MWTEQGDEGFRKTMFVHMGEAREGFEACPRGQKCFGATHFARMNSNPLLVSLFEQLHYEFLE